ASLSRRSRRAPRPRSAPAGPEGETPLPRPAPEWPAPAGFGAGPGGSPGGSIAPPGFARGAPRRQIESAQPTYLGSDLTACLAAAARALGESPVAGKRIIAFTDLAAHSIRLDAPPPVVPPPPGSPPNAPPVRPNVVLVDA